MELLKAALPALVAFVGVCLTAFLGYRQWRKQQDSTRESAFRSDQQSAYRKLWGMLEHVHVQLRTKKVSETEFSENLQEINAFLLLNGIYISKSDAALVNSYVEAVRTLSDLIARQGGEEARRSWSATQEIPPSAIYNVQRLREAHTSAQERRDSLIERFQKVLGGKG